MGPDLMGKWQKGCQESKFSECAIIKNEVKIRHTSNPECFCRAHSCSVMWLHCSMVLNTQCSLFTTHVIMLLTVHECCQYTLTEHWDDWASWAAVILLCIKCLLLLQTHKLLSWGKWRHLINFSPSLFSM